MHHQGESPTTNFYYGQTTLKMLPLALHKYMIVQGTMYVYVTTLNSIPQYLNNKSCMCFQRLLRSLMVLQPIACSYLPVSMCMHNCDLLLQVDHGQYAKLIMV